MLLLLQLARAQHIEDVFSLCFGGVEGNGALMLGDVPPASVNVSLQYTPLVSSVAHPHYYQAKLNDLSVNGTILPVDTVRTVMLFAACYLARFNQLLAPCQTADQV